MSDANTPLQQDLLRRIIEVIHEDGLEPGARLRQSQLAERLSVSRTPVIVALNRLHELGYAEHLPNKGTVLTGIPPQSEMAEHQRSDEALIVAVAKLRREGGISNQFTELELMRLTESDRAPVRQALIKLEELGVVMRRKGYGWQFMDSARDARAREESYNFRVLIECAAIMSPQFALLPAWIDAMRKRHEDVMRAKWTETSSVMLFEMNAEFHLGISAASGNRYLKEAMHRQNQLRRLSNYNWNYGPERVVTTCREHLEILGRLQQGENEIAAALMKRHLNGASKSIAKT